MTLKLVWSLAMLVLAAYMQARARHDFDHGCDEDGMESRGPLRRLWGRCWGYMRWAWAILFLVAAAAVWISWLWALAVAALSGFPPLFGKLLAREASERTRWRRKK